MFNGGELPLSPSLRDSTNILPPIHPPSSPLASPKREKQTDDPRRTRAAAHSGIDDEDSGDYQNFESAVGGDNAV